MSDKCPTCDRPWKRSARTCNACEKPIKRGHKYHFNGSYIQHDDCSNPTLDPNINSPLLRQTQEVPNA